MLKKNLLTIALLAVAAVAQTTPAKTSTATKPSTTTPAKPIAAPAKKTTAPAKPSSQTASAPTSKAASKSAAPSKVPATTKAKAAPTPKPASPAKVKADIQAKVQKPAATKAAAVKTAGRRDPFISPLRLQEDKVKTSLCTTGARCLIIDQVVLKGIVKTQQGMIAMVENPAKKQYNLREKDPVFNGQVMRITGDSLIFRETVTDNLGHQTTREVVKRVTAPVI